MTIDELKREIVATGKKFHFIRAIQLLDETDSAVKFRLEIDDLTFIQIYQNISSGTINYLLVHGFMRVYGRDCCGGKWHRHPFENPSSHDFSAEGSIVVKLSEIRAFYRLIFFLDFVRLILYFRPINNFTIYIHFLKNWEEIL